MVLRRDTGWLDRTKRHSTHRYRTNEGTTGAVDYEHSGIASSRVDRPDLEPGDTVFVGLVWSGDNWVASRVERQPFEEVGDTVRNTVVGTGTETARFEYGIEQYFVPEGSGRVVE